jgi:hypothetical protein
MRTINRTEPAGKIVLFVLILAAASCGNQGQNNSSKSRKANGQIHVEVFKIDTLQAWGYEIVSGNKVFIHQETIPALEGKRTFASKDDALKVGNRVKEKLIEKQPPILTKEEVFALLGIPE